MKHHTHDKGDEGIGFVMADLISKGFKICLPVSTHLPFDLIAVAVDGRCLRLQVKYRTKGFGCVSVSATSQSVSPGKWATTKMIDRKWLDGWAIYCPDSRSVYYFGISELPEGSTKFMLRIDPVKNGQSQSIRMASNYISPDRLLA